MSPSLKLLMLLTCPPADRLEAPISFETLTAYAWSNVNDRCLTLKSVPVVGER